MVHKTTELEERVIMACIFVVDWCTRNGNIVSCRLYTFDLQHCYTVLVLSFGCEINIVSWFGGFCTMCEASLLRRRFGTHSYDQWRWDSRPVKMGSTVSSQRSSVNSLRTACKNAQTKKLLNIFCWSFVLSICTEVRGANLIASTWRLQMNK